MHIELVALEISNIILNDRGAPHVLRWLRERQITTTLDATFAASVFARNAVRVSTSTEDVRLARGAGYGLIIAIGRTEEARADLMVAGADVVLAGFASVPGVLLGVMQSPRRLAPPSALASRT